MSKFWRTFNKGVAGLNKGIPLPLVNLSKYISNIQQGTILLVGGAEGSGKSTLANECFMNYPLQWLKLNPDRKEKIHVEYFNLEIQDEDVEAKLRANWIFRQSKATVKLYIDKIFQKGDNVLTEEEIEWIKKSDEYIEFMSENVNFTAGEEISVGYFYKVLWECAKKYGTMDEDPENPGKYLLHTYVPKDENQYVIFLFDNVNNLNDKKLIDLLSGYCVKFRKACNFTFVLIQQYNRDQQSSQRTFMEPQNADLKESGRTADDSSIVFLTYTPGRFGLSSYQGYDLEEKLGTKGVRLKDVLRFLKISKNRNGADNVYIPYMFNGAQGYVKEMPSPDKWKKNEGGIKDEFIRLFIS